MHRVDLSQPGISRRRMLCKCANGFGGMALAYLLADKFAAASQSNPLAPRPPPLRAQSQIRDLPVHGWRSIPGGYI